MRKNTPPSFTNISVLHFAWRIIFASKKQTNIGQINSPNEINKYLNWSISTSKTEEQIF